MLEQVCMEAQRKWQGHESEILSCSGNKPGFVALWQHIVPWAKRLGRENRLRSKQTCNEEQPEAASNADYDSASVASDADADVFLSTSTAAEDVKSPQHIPHPTSQTRKPRGPLNCLAKRVWKGVRWVGNKLLSNLAPKGPGANDRTLIERTLNVATCIPFFLVGRNVLRVCTSPMARHFGEVFLGLGVVAGLYHATSGAARVVFRKMDYYGIAYSSCVLRATVLGHLPRLAQAAVYLTIPYCPTAVSTVNYLLVEAQCARVAFKAPHLVKEWAMHAAIGTGAAASFVLEDSLLMSWFPYMHAVWHCLAAAGMMTTSTFLIQLEGFTANKARQSALAVR